MFSDFSKGDFANSYGFSKGDFLCFNGFSKGDLTHFYGFSKRDCTGNPKSGHVKSDSHTRARLRPKPIISVCQWGQGCFGWLARSIPTHTQKPKIKSLNWQNFVHGAQFLNNFDAIKTF